MSENSLASRCQRTYWNWRSAYVMMSTPDGESHVFPRCPPLNQDELEQQVQSSLHIKTQPVTWPSRVNSELWVKGCVKILNKFSCRCWMCCVFGRKRSILPGQTCGVCFAWNPDGRGFRRRSCLHLTVNFVTPAWINVTCPLWLSIMIFPLSFFL